MSIFAQRIFTDIYGLVKPKVPLKSWAPGAKVGLNFQEFDPRCNQNFSGFQMKLFMCKLDTKLWVSDVSRFCVLRSQIYTLGIDSMPPIFIYICG